MLSVGLEVLLLRDTEQLLLKLGWIDKSLVDQLVGVIAWDLLQRLHSLVDGQLLDLRSQLLLGWVPLLGH